MNNIGITYHLRVNLAQVTRTYLSVGCYQIAKDELLTTSRHLSPFFSPGAGWEATLQYKPS